MTEYIDLMFEILKTKKTCFRCLKMRYKIHKYIKKLRKEFYVNPTPFLLNGKTALSISKLMDFAILIDNNIDDYNLSFNGKIVMIGFKEPDTKSEDNIAVYRYKTSNIEENVSFNFIIQPVKDTSVPLRFNTTKELIIGLDRDNNSIVYNEKTRNYVYKGDTEYYWLRIIIEAYCDALYNKLIDTLDTTKK